MAPPAPAPTERCTVKRQPARASYERAEIDAVLDEGLVAHVGITVDGQVVVLPMSYGRDGDRLILHGSVASRLLRGLGRGLPVCVTVTLLDGLVLARSSFHHSMNYRSVVVFGVAQRIVEPELAGAALDALVEHVVPGRTAESRAASPAELRQTTVLELSLAEASLKMRTGGAKDEPEDLDLPVWAGVIPLGLTSSAPLPNDDLGPGIAPDPSVTAWSRPVS